MGARYYHPLSGRFISPDPFGHSGSLDLYNYADGDPINYFDPDGRLLMKSWGKVKDFSVKHAKVGIDVAQFGLDIAGMAPVLGAIPDLANAGIHVLRGLYVEAGISATAAIPIIGDIAGAAKIGNMVYEGVNAGKNSFTKAADKELRAMGYQRHHIIPQGHRATKNHKLLELANFDLQSAHNKMYLPSKFGLHPTRSLHRGGHYDSIGIGMAEKMDDILQQGIMGDWTTKQYNDKLMNLLKDTRSGLKQGKIELNSVKK